MQGLDLSGQSLRGYDVIERVGEGGFGVVYRAEQRSVDREVALKVILPEYSEHPDFIDRFQAEALLVARLEHPFIVPLHDYWLDDDGSYLVMRWLSGGSLRERLEVGTIDLPELTKLLEQIADALDFAHGQNVIHRDLKPENILLDEAGNAYISDFGIAKDLASEKMTKTGNIIGSVDYLSPEQAKGHSLSPGTDIYALGLLLFELLTGSHPFAGSSPIQMIQKHLNEDIPFAEGGQSALPAGVDSVIQRATAKDPAHRYERASDLSTAFQQAFGIDELREVSDAAASMPPSETGDRQVGERIGSSTPEEAAVPAFLSIDAPAVEKPAEVFVGRESEIKWLDEFLQGALEGKGQVTFISGEPGQGKTALSRHFASRAMDLHPSLLVAFGTCNAFAGIGDPYHPFRELFGMLAADVDAKWAVGELPREHALRLWEALPDTVEAFLLRGRDLLKVLVDSQRLFSHAAAIESLPEDDLSKLSKLAETGANGGREFQQSQLFEQCGGVLSHLSQKYPILLVLEDLQWADTASTSLLFHLGRRLTGSSVLMIGTYRPSEVALGRNGERHHVRQMLSEVRSQFGNVTLDLDEDPQVSGRHFVDAYLESEPNQLQEAFRKSLFELTAGHPLFVTETLRAMQDRGEIVRNEADEWVEGESLDWGRLPPRVEGVIADRIDRIDDDLRQTLDVACVEGETFTAEVVAHVRELQERGLIHQLSSELEKIYRIVREMGGDSVGNQRLSKYLFRHSLYQKYLYDELGANQRAYLHEAVGSVLETLYSDHGVEIAPQLARHFEEAGDNDKALGYYQLSGHRAINAGALDEAVANLEKALEFVDAESQREARMAVQLELARAYGPKGSYDLARSHLLSALDIARKIGDLSAEANALSQLGRIEGAWLSNPEIGREYLNQALTIARELDDKPLLIRTLRQIGIVAGFPGSDLDEASASIKESLALAREVGSAKDEASALNSLASIAMNQKDLEKSKDYYQQALEIASGIDDYFTEGMVQGNLANVLLYLGDYEQARQLAEKSMANVEKTGSAYLLPGALGPLGVALAELGELSRAPDYMVRQMDAAIALGTESAVIDAIIRFARLRSLQGDPGEAIEWIGLALSLSDLGKDTKSNAELALEAIRGEMAEEEVVEHLNRGSKLDLDTVVRQLTRDGAG